MELAKVDRKESIIKALEKMRQKEQLAKETFKVVAYTKVIKQLQSLTIPVYSIEDLQDVKGIGKKIKEKIEEIIETGKLEQAEAFANNSKVSAIEDLTKVYGIGPVKARDLVENHNIKSIADLENNHELLNDVQKKAIKYVDDFSKRIPRDEMDAHNEFIMNCVKNTDDKLVAVIAGSYRRNMSSSGDIDVLLTHENHVNHEKYFKKLIETLTKHKYIKDTFALGQKKYMGVCKAKYKRQFRRLDIMMTTKEEYPFALLYFTGSAELNTKMRAHAQSKNYTMNEHGIKSKTGQVISDIFEKEEDIFKFLGLKYIRPEDRTDKVELQFE